ncbi:hypothetical protein QGM61_05925 [Pseudohongiella sp. SYSU M77423]|uniref:hypothetical protein n=1 Tax=Pseudohongiella sp. SYSU M77423 TaxID=3042312 RepID=UPI0024807B0D|nr:hypothetical protein [Pseudohongiella sp. SYSU M77423]MDH7943351.1 hypothetical protein [Pseudohongiella sp. SYSU M77423]
MTKTSHSSTPTRLSDHAEENLRFIRSTMEQAGVFTGISGLGYLLTGLTALIAALVAAPYAPEPRVGIWMIELLIATTVASGFTVLKTRRQGRSLRLATTRKLLGAFLPSMIAGGLLTLAGYMHGFHALLPGIWLTLYGAAVMTAGAWSVRVLRIMGGLFMALGSIALVMPGIGNTLMGVGFGGLHCIFGFIIWRRYGG